MPSVSPYQYLTEARQLEEVPIGTRFFIDVHDPIYKFFDRDNRPMAVVQIGRNEYRKIKVED